MLEKRLKNLWEQLLGKKPHMPDFLTGIRLRGIRGIEDLRVILDYPVSVVAGGNATGKSTVLFAAACAYKVPGAGVKDFVPSSLFPDYRPKSAGRQDQMPEITVEFNYITPDGHSFMRWCRARGWSRSFGGRPGASQPQRRVYLRTLSNLSNPSELRGVLSMTRSSTAPDEQAMSALEIDFAQQMLPFRYSEVVNLSSGRKNLLFAELDGDIRYSELHMSSGERSILRLSREIASLNNALVLIDEIETGLHPWVQQLLMLQLQQLALRQNLQIIVTTHSPVILDCVPANGRIFLDRDADGKVVVSPPYKDLLQNALYGRSGESLNILCEDEAAEGVLRGLCDVLLPRGGIRNESVRIGRDTGANEFPVHAAAFRKFGAIDNVVFVLDGDQRNTDMERRIRESAGQEVPIYFLPDDASPEVWAWGVLQQWPDTLGRFILSLDNLSAEIQRANSIFDSASDTPSNIAKHKMQHLAEHLHKEAADILRSVAAHQAQSGASDLQVLLQGLEDQLLRWRAG